MRLKALIAAAAVVVALPALATVAASWHRVGGNESSVTYVDASSITRGSPERQAWAMSHFAKPIDGRVWAARIQYAFDCGAGVYRSLAYVHLGANGEELSNHQSTTSDVRRTPDPGSISENMVKFVCTGQGGTAVADPKVDSETVLKR